MLAVSDNTRATIGLSGTEFDTMFRAHLKRRM
jgi:hypothetical protein